MVSGTQTLDRSGMTVSRKSDQIAAVRTTPFIIAPIAQRAKDYRNRCAAASRRIELRNGAEEAPDNSSIKSRHTGGP